MYNITKGTDRVWVTDTKGDMVWEGNDQTFFIVDKKPVKVMSLTEDEIIQVLIEKDILK